MVHVEDLNGALVFLRHGQGRQVHHAQAPFQGFLESDLLEANGVIVLLRILVVHTVHAGAFQHGFGVDLDSAKNRRRIRGEERITRSGTEDHNAPLFHMADGAASHEGLGDLVPS